VLPREIEKRKDSWEACTASNNQRVRVETMRMGSFALSRSCFVSTFTLRQMV